MMPDTDPVIDDVALVEFVRRTARDTAHRQCLPGSRDHQGSARHEMTEFGLLREAGAVAFTDGRHTIASAQMRRAHDLCARLWRSCCLRNQRPDLAGANGVMNEGLFASWLGLSGTPREAEVIPLERDLRSPALTKAATTPPKSRRPCQPMPSPAPKADGANVTAAVSINNLSLNENDVGEYRTFFRLSPPLRAEDDRQAMIEALRDGTIDVIVSSHDPQDVDTKRLPFADAASRCDRAGNTAGRRAAAASQWLGAVAPADRCPVN
jgi:dihydroorotase